MREEERIAQAAARIVAFYAASRRALPWRDSPTPYQVWISEIMLQQTRIEAVIPYYRRFLAELPEVRALAEVDETRLLKLWEGLGYYSRARNLKKAAQTVMAEYGGELPREAAALKKLPGIGDYTAGAIASIAYGQPEPAVDGNVLRVAARLLALEDDVLEPKTRRRVTELLRAVYPTGENAALLTEGLMELGETLCVPNREARCGCCPLRSLCLARETDSVAHYPLRRPPKPRRVEERTVLLLRCGERWAVRRRPDRGLLAGLWEFPNVEGALSGEEAAASVPGARGWTPCGESVHVFTHVEWHMRGFLIDCAAEDPACTWVTAEELRERCPVPTAFRYFRRIVERESLQL